MLIRDPQARAERSRYNRATVLRFLRDERFSDSATLAKLLSLKGASTARRLLNSMVKDQLISRNEFPAYGRKPLVIWGITDHGLAMAFEADEVMPDNLYPFRPSKFNPLTFPHKHGLQCCRIAAMKSGWSEWRLASVNQKGQKSADAVGFDGVQWIAIEYERTVKARKRYIDVVRYHLEAVRNQQYRKIIYVAPDAAIRDRIQRFIFELEGREIALSGGAASLSREILEQLFSFQTLEEFEERNV